MNDMCSAFKHRDRMQSFSYNNVDVQQLVQTLMTSNEMLQKEVYVPAEGRRRRRMSKLKASAKDFKPTLDTETDHKVRNV